MGEEAIDYKSMFNIDPLKGYKRHKGFPNCCVFHMFVYQKLNKAEYYFINGSQDLDLPNIPFRHYRSKILDRLTFTENHIANYINNINWYNHIIDYIFYNVVTLNPIKGARYYLIMVELFLRLNKAIPVSKRQRLIDYVTLHFMNEEKYNKEVKTYWETFDKWLITFSSDINYLAKVLWSKIDYDKIFVKETRFNIYLGEEVAVSNNIEETIEALYEVTNSVLQTVDTVELVKVGDLSNEEVINAHYRLKQTKLLMNEHSHGENKYLDLIISWLINTKQYLEEITPYLKKASCQLAPSVATAEELLKAGLVITPDSTEAPDSIEDKLVALAKEDNKFWRGLPMEVVIKHFRVFMDRKSDNGNAYLTPEQFFLFIERAFLGKQKITKQQINCAPGEKGFIVKRFYELFVLAMDKYKELNKKDKYIRLITDNLSNWADEYEKIKFLFKPNITRKNW